MDKTRQTEACWRPIASAPKDGSEIIIMLVDKDSGEIEIKNAWFESTWKRINYSRGDYEYFPFYDITHWMPVPTASSECPAEHDADVIDRFKKALFNEGRTRTCITKGDFDFIADQLRQQAKGVQHEPGK